MADRLVNAIADMNEDDALALATQMLDTGIAPSQILGRLPVGHGDSG